MNQHVTGQSSVFVRHPVATFCGLLLLIAAAGLIALETGLSLMYRPGSLHGAAPAGRTLSFREYPPDAELWVRNQAPEWVAAGGLVDTLIRLDIDSLGFIEPSAVHPRADLSIVFLGGSTTECLLVRPHLRFPFLVGRLLEDSLRLATNTFNGGRSGNHSLHSLLALQAKVIPLKPDYVVVMEAVNDLSYLTHLDSYWGSGVRTRALLEEPRAPWQGPGSVSGRMKQAVRLLFPQSYMLLYRIRQVYRGPEAVDEFAAVRGDSRAASPESIEQSYRRALQSTVQLARTWGIRPVLMTQAHRFRPDQDDRAELRRFDPPGMKEPLTYEEFLALYRRLNEVAREVAREMAVPVIDLEAEFAASPATMYDPVHYNERGSQEVAVLIAARLAAIVRADRSAAPSP